MKKTGEYGQRQQLLARLRSRFMVANIGGLNPMATPRAQAADHSASDRGGRKVRRATGLNEPTIGARCRLNQRAFRTRARRHSPRPVRTTVRIGPLWAGFEMRYRKGTSVDPEDSRVISSTRNRSLWSVVCFIPLALLVVRNAPAGVVSPLGARGHATVPEVQKFDPGGNDFQFGEGWRLRLGEGVGPNDIAVETLREDLQSRFRVTLSQPGATGGHAKTVSLAIAPNSIEVGEATDRDRRALAEQAYKIALAPGSVSVKANAAPGLFYGIETLIQLLRPKGGSLWLPEGEITDWPDLGLRIIYWDDAHH